MRTKTLLVAALLGVASIAATMAQATSVNAVGYVNKEIGMGYNLITNPLSMGNNTVAELIPTAPDGTEVLVFRDGGYTSTTYVAVLSSWTNPALTLPVGEGFFVNNPGDAVTVTFIGAVLQGADTNKTVPAGLSMQGSLVPQGGMLGTDLGFPGGDGDTVYSWNGTGWVTHSYSDLLGGWLSQPTLAVGDAVFVDKAATSPWERDFVIQ